MVFIYIYTYIFFFRLLIYTYSKLYWLSPPNPIPSCSSTHNFLTPWGFPLDLWQRMLTLERPSSRFVGFWTAVTGCCARKNRLFQRCFFTTPYHPCMVYLPTFGWFFPYLDVMGTWENNPMFLLSCIHQLENKSNSSCQTFSSYSPRKFLGQKTN